MTEYAINKDLHEYKVHGEYSFPYAVYSGKIPEFLSYYPLHWHEEMEFVLVTSGIGDAIVNSVCYELKKDDILIVRPHDIHSLSRHQEESFTYFNILFRFSLLEDKLDECFAKRHFSDYSNHTAKLPVVITKDYPCSAALRECLEDLTKNRKIDPAHYELMIKANLFKILYILEQQKTPDDNNPALLESNHKIKMALSYLFSHYQEPISIQDAASYCCYSNSYFMKFFKLQTGCSFIKYLNQYRLEQSLRLLYETNMTITDIAASVGFDSLPYFTRCFQSRYHVSPGQARKSRKLRYDHRPNPNP